MTEKNLYNIHDGVAGRDGGPYLDQVEAREAERRRAAVEGREPDYDHLPATAGQPLVTADQLLRLQGTSNIPSQELNRVQAAALDQYAETDTFPIEPHSVRDTTADEDHLEEAESEGAHPAVPSNPTIASVDPENEEVEGQSSTDDSNFPLDTPSDAS